jgi:hypothetical protein
VASASTLDEFCGGDLLNSSSVGFPTPYLTGSPAGNVTCAAFTAPVGDVITSVEFGVNNVFTGAVGGTTSTVTFTYDITGFSLPVLTSTATGVGSSNIPPGFTGAGCSTAPPHFPGGPENIDCTESVPNVPSAGPIDFTIFATWTAGQLQSAGTETIAIYAEFTYGPSSVPPPPIPEPASLFMIGGGLIALALVARRKRA